MDHPINTHVMQHLTNGVPFDSYWSPAFVSDGRFSHTIDVDRSLPEIFSLLNLSPAVHADQPQFLRNIPIGEGGSSIGTGEGFVPSDLGINSVLNRQRWRDDIGALPRHCSSGFDFDRKSNKLLHPDPQFEIPDKKLKFQRSDDYEQQKPSCISSKFQNPNPNQNVQFMRVWSLKELKGSIYNMAKDQYGCRILQAMLERSTKEEVEILLSEVVNFIADLMKDQFGNYLIQKLVSMCNDGQKLRLILSLTKVPADIILVCVNPHGTRAVQKLLENLNMDHVKLVMLALYRAATTLAVDPNGHHVIQYCLIHFHNDINKPILTEIANECYKIATDRSGCCVLQTCVEHSCGEVRTHILTEIMANSVRLAEDPFGNYVLQHILRLDIPELTAVLVRQLKGSFASLSCNKYASNVVEKCLIKSGEEISTRIIMELVRSPNAFMLLVDPYANFVIQSALKVSKGLAHECLCGLISKNTLSMRTNLYGKKILERFEKKRVNFA